MKENEGILAVKLHELEQRYEKMQSRLKLCRRRNEQEIQADLEKALADFQQTEFALQQKADECRSRAVASMSTAQKEYFHRIRSLLEQEIAKSLHSEGSTPMEDRLEAAALYAEYAIDFAAHSMDYALIAALRAIEMELRCEQ